ncbi:hypothetical protein FHS27_002500 [Rhodopirellula rubra]|uniref:DUF4332 domain-containing protein n=1 Tax=Aporhodopirellula rubra TaxID=980271 RepID=A0A7W5DY75_9BACT|nr:DUF4332 domain-containing protein [Aporhodopirellula rubra]MBB3206688.1 hypothetical protein [Aporhodopirellula rubra]
MFEFFKRLVFPAKAEKNDVVFWVDLPEIPKPPRNHKNAAVNRSSAAELTTRQHASPEPAISARSIAEPVIVGSSSADPHRRTVQRGKPQPMRRRAAESPLSSHRERLLAMRIEHLKLCPVERCEQLAAIGVQTAGDLIYGDPKRISQTFRKPERAERAIRRYRAAIRLALAVDSMMPRDALLLVAIHRRSVASLSRESAAQLHRDLERFSLSSRGSKMIGRRGVPSLRRVKAWVATCREMAAAATAPPEFARQAA